MSIAQFVSEYGYAALAIGCLLEGETVVLLAGLAVHRGLLAGPSVWLIALFFSFCGDQAWYQVGRHYGERLILRFPKLAQRRAWLQAKVFAHPDALVLGLRFMVGLRTVGPILIGAGFVPPRRFLWLNLLGAALWVSCFVSAGYFFGELAERLLPRIKAVEEAVFVALILCALAYQGLRLWQRRSHEHLSHH